MDSIRLVSRRHGLSIYNSANMSYLASLWTTLQHKSANASSEGVRVESRCPHLRLLDKICSTMSHVPDESGGKRRQAKAIGPFVFIESMSQTCMCRGFVVLSRNIMAASGVDMERK